MLHERRHYAISDMDEKHMFLLAMLTVQRHEFRLNKNQMSFILRIWLMLHGYFAVYKKRKKARLFGWSVPLDQ